MATVRKSEVRLSKQLTGSTGTIPVAYGRGVYFWGSILLIVNTPDSLLGGKHEAKRCSYLTGRSGIELEAPLCRRYNVWNTKFVIQSLQPPFP